MHWVVKAILFTVAFTFGLFLLIVAVGVIGAVLLPENQMHALGYRMGQVSFVVWLGGTIALWVWVSQRERRRQEQERIPFAREVDETARERFHSPPRNRTDRMRPRESGFEDY
jgi:hypothetical protein